MFAIIVDMHTLFWITGAVVWVAIALVSLTAVLVLLARAAIASGCVLAQLYLARLRKLPLKTRPYAVWHNRFFDFTIKLAWHDMWHTIDVIRYYKNQKNQ